MVPYNQRIRFSVPRRVALGMSDSFNTTFISHASLPQVKQISPNASLQRTQQSFMEQMHAQFPNSSGVGNMNLAHL